MPTMKIKQADGTWEYIDRVNGHTHPELASTSDVAELQSLVGDTSVTSQINAAMASVPKITYGTTDLTVGTSTLATGAIYLVYEAV